MCGIFGVSGCDEASNLTYLGLYALQHRGQESAGIVSTDGNRIFKRVRRSLVSESFDTKSFDYLRGSTAIGHVRYGTTGDGDPRNVQPFLGTGNFGTLAVAHNGNLTNFQSLRRRLEAQGAVFQSSMDTEVILHLVGLAPGADLVEKVKVGLRDLEGAFSLLLMTEREMIAVRDPMGFRPLCLGSLKGAPVVASETCAFDLINARFEREIEPGEMVVFRGKEPPTRIRFAEPVRRAACVFEHVYFARPDSTVFGKSVYQVRKSLGRELAREHPVDADLVMPVPDSGVVTAIGYAEELRLPFEMGFIRNHYVGRTFIEPRQSIRGFGVKVKLNPVESVLSGKRVAVVDDSIVRGTTSRKIVTMLREAGAHEVHLLVSCPPWTNPCTYGIDTPTKGELIGAGKSIEEVRKFIAADSLAYLSLEGVYRAVGNGGGGFCDACFTGKYLTKIEN